MLELPSAEKNTAVGLLSSDEPTSYVAPGQPCYKRTILSVTALSRPSQFYQGQLTARLLWPQEVKLRMCPGHYITVFVV